MFVYILVSSGKVSLRDLYYDLDCTDIVQLYEIIVCEKYNNWIMMENETNKLQQKGGKR